MQIPLDRFAESLRALVNTTSADSAEACWAARCVEDVGWLALESLGPSTDAVFEPVLAEVDGLIRRVMVDLAAYDGSRAALHLRTFRLPALERLAHATTATLTAHRAGHAGLMGLLGDVAAPVGQRYHAFVLLARRHAPSTWPLIRRYLVAEAHYAFLGIATEAARYYPLERPAALLADLFATVRRDRNLRTFLSPRILMSLAVLEDPVALPLLRELAVAGHTDPDPCCCEVTHALLMLRRLTGSIPPNSKFAGPDAEVAAWLDKAATSLATERDRLHPVSLL